MKKENMKPIFGVIANTGGHYSVDFEAEKYEDGSAMSTGCHKSGCDVSTIFGGLPENLPVIDYTDADAKKVINLILDTEGIQERDMCGIPAAEYIEKAKECGARITTVGAVLRSHTTVEEVLLMQRLGKGAEITFN